MNKNLTNIIIFSFLLFGFVCNGQDIYQNWVSDFECHKTENNKSIRVFTDAVKSVYKNNNSRCESLYGSGKGIGSNSSSDSSRAVIDVHYENGDVRYFDYETGEEVDKPEGSFKSRLPKGDSDKKNNYRNCLANAAKTFANGKRIVNEANELNKTNGCDVEMQIYKDHNTTLMIDNFINYRNSIRELAEKEKKIAEQMKIEDQKFQAQIAKDKEEMYLWFKEVQKQNEVTFEYYENLKKEYESKKEEMIETKTYSTGGIIDGSMQDVNNIENTPKNYNHAELLQEITNFSKDGNGNEILYIDTNDDNIPDEKVTLAPDGTATYESISETKNTNFGDLNEDATETNSSYENSSNNEVNFNSSNDDLSDSFKEVESSKTGTETYNMPDGSEIQFVDSDNDGTPEQKITTTSDGQQLYEDLTIDNSPGDIKVDPNYNETGGLIYSDLDENQAKEIYNNPTTYEYESNIEPSNNVEHISNTENLDENVTNDYSTYEYEDDIGITFKPTSHYANQAINQTINNVEGNYNLGNTSSIRKSSFFKGLKIFTETLGLGYEVYKNPDNDEAKLNLVGSTASNVGSATGVIGSPYLSRIPKAQYNFFESAFENVNNTLDGNEVSNSNFDNSLFEFITGVNIKPQLGDYSLSRWQLIRKYGFVTGMGKYYSIHN